MSEYIIHVEDAKTLYRHTDFPFPLDAYLREEVVRCRDCRHFIDGECMVEDGNGDYLRLTVPPSHFCAWGERRNSE